MEKTPERSRRIRRNKIPDDLPTPSPCQSAKGTLDPLSRRNRGTPDLLDHRTSRRHSPRAPRRRGHRHRDGDGAPGNLFPANGTPAIQAPPRETLILPLSTHRSRTRVPPPASCRRSGSQRAREPAASPADRGGTGSPLFRLFTVAEEEGKRAALPFPLLVPLDPHLVLCPWVRFYKMKRLKTSRKVKWGYR